MRWPEYMLNLFSKILFVGLFYVVIVVALVSFSLSGDL